MPLFINNQISMIYYFLRTLTFPSDNNTPQSVNNVPMAAIQVKGSFITIIAVTIVMIGTK